MVALLTTLPTPCSSFSSLQTLFLPVPTQLHTHLYPSPQLHESFSLTQLKPIVAQLGSKSPRCVGVQCISSTTSIPGTVMGSLSFPFHEIGLSETEITLLLQKHPSINDTSYESLGTRIASLQSLGIIGIALCHLIMRRPDVLTAQEIDPFMHYIGSELKGKLQASQLRRLLTALQPRFLVGFDQKVSLIINHGVPEEILSHVLNNVNLTKAICLKSAEELERTLAFLDHFGGVDIIVRRPAILNYDLDTQLIPRIGFLMELSGGDEGAVGSVLRKLPAILAYSKEHVEGHVELLRSFAGLSDQQIFKIVLVFPNVMSASKTRKLHPRIDFLKQCGLDSNEIFKFLTKAPLFLGLSFGGNLAYKLSFLVKIGFEPKTKELAFAMGAVSRTSTGNLQKVIELFLSYGLSLKEIVAMTNKHPQILQYNPRSLEEKMKYLITDMGRGIEELLAFPAFLGYKLDDRIKQRYEVRKKFLGEGMSINKLLTVSARKFEVKKTEKSTV